VIKHVSHVLLLVLFHKYKYSFNALYKHNKLTEFRYVGGCSGRDIWIECWERVCTLNVGEKGPLGKASLEE